MSLKRANWIEGVTTSKRILRDLAEIATTAIQDENGPVKGENWELVYPRPFEENDVARGDLVADSNDLSGLRYIPTGLKTEKTKLTGVDPITLQIKEVVADSVAVKSANGAVTYAENTDYVYDAVANTVTRVEGGAIFSGSEVIIEYRYTFNQILETVPVIVEEKLTTPAADRTIDSIHYQVDYLMGTVKFLVEPPKAEYYALDFVERTTTFTRTDYQTIQLIQDVLDPTGRTFKLPSTYKSIARADDYMLVASTASGVNATGDLNYVLDPVANTVKFDSEPNLTATGAKLFYTGYEFNSLSGSDGAHELARAELSQDVTDPTLFYITGVTTKLNELDAHKVEIYTQNTAPIFKLHLSEEDAGYEIIDAGDYVVDYLNPAIQFITAPSGDFVVTFKSRDAVDIEIGLNKVVDRIVLKTITTPENTVTAVAGRDFGSTDTAESLEMYVEIVKPKNLINPETGLESYQDHLGYQIATQPNNHYVIARMFDTWDDATQNPLAPIKDSLGNILVDGASVSNWVKYAWFQDWKEYLVDELDDDAGISNLNDGILFKEVVTNGINENLPIQFWLSTNNNRMAVVLMGDPSLDQDNFLTSFAYFGRIQPFYDTKYVIKKDETGTIVTDVNGDPMIEEVRQYFDNDVSGNFGITAGSSTLPVEIGQPPKGQAVLLEKPKVVRTSDGTLEAGGLYDSAVYHYLVTYLTDEGESKPTPINDVSKLVVNEKTVNPTSTGYAIPPMKGISIGLKFKLPDEATGYKIYRFHYATADMSKVMSGSTAYANQLKLYTDRYAIHGNYNLVTVVNKLGDIREFEFVDDGSILTMSSETGTLYAESWNGFYAKLPKAYATERGKESVIRDKFTGAILDVRFSERFGKETASGVNDVMMYKTRSGLRFQRHQAAFITTEEFMKKEKSGQSRWTGKFHLSPIYIEHGYDKQRGWLDGVMAVDDSGIAHLDELIVEKDTPREEIYKFFRVNAPYSLFNNSPNYSYGLAIVKSSMKWTN